MSHSAPITRLNAALEGRYLIESELGEGGMATARFLSSDRAHSWYGCGENDLSSAKLHLRVRMDLHHCACGPAMRAS